MSKSTSAGAFGKHLTAHKAANAHGIGQSGIGLWSVGQQSIWAMDDIEAMAPAFAVAWGIATGANASATITRIADSRLKRDSNLNKAPHYLSL
jgi:hypothetical protein